MLLTFWGTRGSISTPGRSTEKYGGNTPCIYISCGDHHIILDAGTGIRNLGLSLAGQIAAQDQPPTVVHLFLSHTHWDHIQGLPFFGPAYMNTELRIYGSPEKTPFLESILGGQMNTDYFPVKMSAFAHLKIMEVSQEAFQIGPVNIEWQEQYYHPGGSVRFKFSVGDRSIVYATDVELDAFVGNDSEPKFAEQEKEYMDFIEGADLLIADGQYTQEEYDRSIGWGHTSLPLLMPTAYKAKVKQLAVFHHDPQHSDTFLDELWVDYLHEYQSKKPSMHVFWAREGMTLKI
jgi:phosphoribosyl 1,2-cyclic phosphodiesterase